MIQSGKLESAKQIYITAAEALNKILQETKDDENFQIALKEKMAEILDKAQKTHYITSPLINKKTSADEQMLNFSGSGSQVNVNTNLQPQENA